MEGCFKVMLIAWLTALMKVILPCTQMLQIKTQLIKPPCQSEKQAHPAVQGNLSIQTGAGPSRQAEHITFAPTTARHYPGPR